MRVTTSKSKNSESFYINMAYVDKNGKSTSKIFKKLGTLEELSKKLSTDRDGVMLWAKEQARLATEQHKKENELIHIPFSPNQLIATNQHRSFNCGYLFLQSITSNLKLDNICRNWYYVKKTESLNRESTSFHFGYIRLLFCFSN